jgi:hypothetical protein
VDIIVDFIGQSYFQQNHNSVALGGEIVMLNCSLAANFSWIGIQPFVKKRIRIQGNKLRSRGLEYRGKPRHGY